MSSEVADYPQLNNPRITLKDKPQSQKRSSVSAVFDLSI